MKKTSLASKLVAFINLFSIPGFRQETHSTKQTDTLLSEQLKLLYSNLPISIIGNTVLAVSLVIVQASVIPHILLFSWSVLLLVLLLFRTGLFIAWRRYIASGIQNKISLWLLRFRLSVLATGFIWGLSGILLVSPAEPGHNIYVSFILAGVCAGAITTLAIDRLSAISFLLPALIPQIIFFISVGDIVSINMSVMCALFLFFLLASARQSGAQMQENFFLRHKAIENEAQFSHLLENSPIATRIVDKINNKVVFANSSYISLIDSSPDKVIGVMPSCYYANQEIFSKMMQRIHHGEHITNELVELCEPDNHAWTKWALASYFPVIYQDKPAILGWFYDITERKLEEDMVEHMAYHDLLTGLPNRLLFMDRLKMAMTNADRDQDLLAVMFVDLDKFKPVNDMHGHDVGDLLLKAVAERIHSCLRKSDSAARIGGDEFVILLCSLNTVENALVIADKVRMALDQPFEINGLIFDISSSIGVSIYPDYADVEQELLKQADIAMYHAKAEGRNRVRLYHSSMH